MTESRVEIVDSDILGRAAGALDWPVQKALVTIQAHCVAIMDETDNPTIRDLVGCISQNALEIAQVLTGNGPKDIDDFRRDLANRINAFVDAKEAERRSRPQKD